MKVFVYYNLHRKCFSVKALEGEKKGLVIQHLNDVIIHNPTFKVSQAGRQRVIVEQRKNVHAGVVGQWFNSECDPKTSVSILNTMGRAVTYNPYRFASFVYRDSETPIDDAPSLAALHSDGQRATITAIA